MGLGSGPPTSGYPSRTDPGKIHLNHIVCGFHCEVLPAKLRRISVRAEPALIARAASGRALCLSKLNGWMKFLKSFSAHEAWLAVFPIRLSSTETSINLARFQSRSGLTFPCLSFSAFLDFRASVSLC